MAISVHILDMYYTFGRRSFQKADHPRGCGEHLYSSSFLPYLKGIIPADAGNTTTMVFWSQAMRDHPRGCGEHKPAKPRKKSYHGSSPRMRGTLPGTAPRPSTGRIIPADAGNTLRNPSICKYYLLPCNANQCNADQRNEINNAIEFDLKCLGLQ